MSRSVFSRIIAGEIPAKVEYEDDKVIVIHDIHPKAPTHLLFILKEEIPNIEGFSEHQFAGMNALFQAIQKVAAAQKLKDYRLVINNGPGAGQSVFHFHCHFLARKAFSDDDL